MKYKNYQDNLYDTKYYKNIATKPIDRKTLDKTMIDVKMVDKVIKEAISIMDKSDSSKKVLIGIGILCIFKYEFLLVFIPVFIYFFYYSYYKTVEVKYRLTAKQSALYRKTISDIEKVRQSSRIYWIKSISKVREIRYTAGAGTSIDPHRCVISSEPPFPFETNIKILSVQLPNESVSFFPDRIVIIKDGRIATVAYDQLKVEYSAIQYIEEHVTYDTKVLEMTWQYVNKDGSPDRRFKNNCQLPVCAYGELHVTAGQALNLVLDFSNRKPFES